MSKSKQEVVGMLQAYVTAVTANAINHQFQAQVFGNQAFGNYRRSMTATPPRNWISSPKPSTECLTSAVT